MAINYYANIGMIGSDIEMNKNELKLPVIDNLATQPAAAASVEGQMYFDTTAGDKTMYFFNGTAWVEMDGSGSGVEQISATNGTFVEFNSGTNLVNVKGNVDFGTFDLAATGTPSGTNFLRGDNVWATPAGSYTSWTLGATTGTDNEIADGDDVDFVGTTGISTSIATAGAKSTITINNTGVTSIVAGTNISVSSATGAVTVSSTDTNNTSLGIANDAGTEQFKVTDAVDLEFAAAGGASVAFDSTNKRVTYTAPSNTNETYTLPVAAGAANSAILNLTAGGSGSGVKSAVTINGTNNQIAISETAGNNGQVTVGLPSSVTIGGTFTSDVLDITTTATIGTDVTIGGDIDLTGQLDMNGSKVVSLGNATLSSDAINLGQVQGLIAGVGLFKGGYNATTGLTTDLGAGNGSLDGASNIALDLGDFFVVTTGGTAFYTTTLEIGDTIYANQNITASSTPAESVYTVVIQDQNVAGAGASDAATQKGVAGFDSATFSVTSNGFVTSDVYAGTTTKGVVPTGGSATTFLRGDGTFVTPTNTNTQRAAGTGLSLSGNTINANVNATVQTVAKEGVSATADRTYELQVDSSDQLVVNVPWSDSNTDTGITGVTLATGTSSGAPLTESIASRELTLTSNTYAGAGNIGYVPTGGGSTTFLRGDGTWVTPTDTNIVTSVAASTTGDEKGIIVSPTTGAVKVGLDIKGLTNITADITDSDFVVVYDASTDTNVKTPVRNLVDPVRFATTITAFGTVTHNLGSFDVFVQLYDNTTKETIHAEVDRATTNTVAISGGSFPGGDIRVLCSLV